MGKINWEEISTLLKYVKRTVRHSVKAADMKTSAINDISAEIVSSGIDTKVRYI